MALNLRGKSLRTLLDFSPREIQYLLDLARDLKREKYTGVYNPILKGKNIVVLFQKDSTRTRCAFEVAAFDLGMNVTYLGPSGSQMGKKETVKDTARVLGRMYDGIEFRGYKQSDVEELIDYAGVPVWNGLTDQYHPTQILADFMTIIDYKKTLKGIKLVYCGDGRNNMGNSLMIGASKMGMEFTICAPKKFWPEQQLIDQCQKIAKETEAVLNFEEDPMIATKNADVIYTDVWVSMGEPAEVWKERIELLSPYQVNMKMINNAKNDVIFMHCLPAFHNTETDTAKDIEQKFGLKEMEVTEEVFESKHSVVFEEAENRLHSIKAIILATIGG